MAKFKIFTDFDGTISINDVGDALFEQFTDTDWEQVVLDWKMDKISSREVFSHGCEKTRITKQQLEAFSDEQQIDPFFKDFVEYCQEKSYPITVLSDGLDFYIRRILDHYGFNDLKVFANQLVFLDYNQIKPEFPYYGKGCLVCGNCKGYHLRKFRQQGDILVYIGDGYSDRCAVPETDILFAKRDLKEYCMEKNIAFHEFENFNDVLEKFRHIEKKY